MTDLLFSVTSPLLPIVIWLIVVNGPGPPAPTISKAQPHWPTKSFSSTCALEMLLFLKLFKKNSEHATATTNNIKLALDLIVSPYLCLTN